MRILLLTQYYPPETGAAQQRLSDLAERLSCMGHKVTVLTSMPNYPRGEIFQQYRRRFLFKERENNVSIIRIWNYVSRSRGFFSRLLNYCSFAFIAFWIGILVCGKQEVIFTESPPLFLGITGFVLSRWYRAPLILNVSDLWPQSAISMGVLHNKLLIRMSYSLELFIYRKCMAITGQTDGIVRSILDRTSSIPVELITNGVDPQRFEDSDKYRGSMREKLNFKDLFVVGFTGLHGLAYDFDTIFKVAELMQSRNPQVLFAFFGDGPVKQYYFELAKAKGFENVKFFPPQPASVMPGVFSSLDAAIIPLKNCSFYEGTLPSRLFDCMASGLPVILSIVEGEATRMLKRAEGGICVSPGDIYAIADAIEALFEDRQWSRKLGINARDYIFRYYDRREIALRFAQLLPKDRAPNSVGHLSNNSHDEVRSKTAKAETAVGD